MAYIQCFNNETMQVKGFTNQVSLQVAMNNLN